jgi:hypothetical protein
MPSRKTSPAFVPNAPLDPNTFPFDQLEPCYVVSLVDRHGLHEALAQTDDGAWIFRALNERGMPLVTAPVVDVRSFELPIFFCFATRNRQALACVVSGENFDIATDNPPEVAFPLFQAVHAVELIRFARLALAAGFSVIDLSNGHDSWEGDINDLISGCEALVSNADAHDRSTGPFAGQLAGAEGA